MKESISGFPEVFLGGEEMKDIIITDTIKYIGADDKDIDLFESQYVVPNGVSYNSYVILDEKVAVMDTVDARRGEEWLNNLEEALGGRTVDYLVVSHMEPDHAANVQALAEKYPEMKIVGNAKTFPMIEQFFDLDLSERSVVVAEGDTLKLGSHELTFVMAPMVHWPEVMVAYESSEKILFSADGFGKFGALDTEEDWACEARRYYFNIVGKYGAQVQALLKKAATLDIQMICPLHGPILKENLAYYIGKYQVWSSYEPEDEGILVAYASIHGNTRKAAVKLKEILEAKGAKKVAITDLSRDDMAEAVEDAFRYDKMVLAAATYDGGVFPCMEEFLHHLKSKTYRKRTVALIENGSWAPVAAKTMRSMLEQMKDITVCDKVVTIMSAVKDSTVADMEALAEELLAK
jgi:flavorubredoxin